MFSSFEGFSLDLVILLLWSSSCLVVVVVVVVTVSYCPSCLPGGIGYESFFYYYH